MKSANHLADALFDYVSDADFSCEAEHKFDLPGLSIAGQFSDNRYLAYCLNSFTKQPAEQETDPKQISVAVLDSLSHPQMPVGALAQRDFSIKVLDDYLRPHGLYGAYDANKI